MNKYINMLHEHALRLAFNIKSFSFQELLRKDKSIIIHEINIQVLLTKTLKEKSRLSLEIATVIF